MLIKLGIRLFARAPAKPVKFKPIPPMPIPTKQDITAIAPNQKEITISSEQKKKKSIFQIIKEQKQKTPDAQLVADNSLHEYVVPTEISKPAKKVFSKHNATSVRIWGQELNLLYRRQWCSEKPRILSGIPNFSTDPEYHGRIKTPKPIDTQQQFEPENKLVYKKRDLYDQDQIEAFKYERSHAVAYLKNRMPKTYYANKRILYELKLRMPFYTPNVALDFGAGLGSAIWAAIDIFPSISRPIAVEPNENMRSLGKYMTRELKSEVLWLEALSMLPSIGNISGI